jgi:hypothetical protein
MHGAEHRMRMFLRSKDRISTAGILANDHPFRSPVAGADAHQRLPVRCDRKPQLLAWNLIRLKQLQADAPIFNRVEPKTYAPIGIPLRSFLHGSHDSRCTVMKHSCFSSQGLGRKTALLETECHAAIRRPGRGSYRYHVITLAVGRAIPSRHLGRGARFAQGSRRIGRSRF